MPGKNKTRPNVLNIVRSPEFYEILDLKTNRVIRVRDRKLYERYISKDSKRYVKAD